MTDERPDARLSRRRLLAAAGGGAVAAAAAGGGYALAAERDGDRGAAVAFHGERQAGIATAAQDRLVFGAFDVRTRDVRELRELLRAWTAAAERMTAGEPTAAPARRRLAGPPDTGEALGLPASRLTLTFGLGPSLFDDRFGLARRRPRALVPLGPLPGELLDPARSDGDLCVQACADDPQVAFHAVRNLRRIGEGVVAPRWLQFGFGRTSSTTRAQQTPRNLMGFKDGTNNLRGEDAAELGRFVWVGDEEPQRWFRGGSYLVARRIRMQIEAWDATPLHEQQRVFGRFRASGAPLTGRSEHDPVDLAARRPDGTPTIAWDAHVRLAGPAANGGMRLLRRGYSYTDGVDPVSGDLDAGLFFICFQRDPQRQFAAIQFALGGGDALSEYVRHTASALFAIPPGIRRGGYVAESLFV